MIDSNSDTRSALRRTCQPPFWDYPLQANEIIPRLYVADMYTATDPPTLKRLQITHIVSVVHTSALHPYPSNLKHLNLPIEDRISSNMARYLDQAVEWIKNAMNEDESANVVVHCMCGISRSPSVVIAYLMATQGMSLTDSLSYVKAKRRISRPNSGFVDQLADYEEKLKGRATVAGL
jgi:atypical dual specificity phosphatase